MSADPSVGLLDTNILILRARIDPHELPDRMAVSAITLAELSAGVQLVTGDDVEDRVERARRTDVLQRAENEFDPLPFDADAARAFGALSAAVRGIGRTPRRRVADLMIAAVAVSNGLALYTTNPADFRGAEALVQLVAVTRP